MNELHNKLEDVVGLIPLIESGNRYCHYVAAYIAAQKGEDAASIFGYLFPLINSQWSEVRDEACDCFLNCTADPAHYLALLSLLEDEEQAIRLQVITILFGLSEEIMAGIYSSCKKVDPLSEVVNGMEILMNGYESSISQRLIQNSNFEESKITKVCSYVAAYKCFGGNEGFKLIAKKYDEEDIRKHYHLYFEED